MPQDNTFLITEKAFWQQNKKAGHTSIYFGDKTICFII
jgi:hypothetical protein